MKVYTYSEARRRLSKILDTARKEQVFIKRRGGETFCLRCEKPSQSPFEVTGINTQASTEDIVQAVRESRERESPRDT